MDLNRQILFDVLSVCSREFGSAHELACFDTNESSSVFIQMVIPVLRHSNLRERRLLPSSPSDLMRKAVLRCSQKRHRQGAYYRVMGLEALGGQLPCRRFRSCAPICDNSKSHNLNQLPEISFINKFPRLSRHCDATPRTIELLSWSST